MKKTLIFVILLCAISFSLNAQNNENNLSISGTIMDESGEVLPGVAVSVKNDISNATMSDEDGRFKLNSIKEASAIEFSYVGYKKYELILNRSLEREKIVLKSDINEMDEIVVTAQGSQRKISITAAITTVDPAELQVPAVSLSNMLGGRVPGIIAVTRSGEPGSDFSEFWIRGISTFGANKGPLVLVDGIEGNLNDLDPADIESFAVLKDASSTAVYGMKGANGIVVVTTKRGKAGKMKFTYKGNVSYSSSPRMPEYVDANQYAALANEANVVRGSKPIYSDVALELFRSGLDPDMYPNVDWQDVILKDNTWYNQHHLSMSGGGENARYYLSFGYMEKDAIFNTDQSVNKYNPNVNWKKYNARMNIDANLTKTTTLSLGLETVIANQASPGFTNDKGAADTGALWTTQANLTPVTVPIKYSTGQLAAMGANGNEYNPYALLNYTGLISDFRNTTILNIGLKQDLRVITDGLVADVKFSYTGNTDNKRKRKKTPYLGYATRRNRDGSLYVEPRQNSADPVFTQDSYMDRKYYGEASVNYNKVFGNHRFGGLLHYYMEDFISSAEDNDLDAIPKRYQAISGRATYSFKDTYFAEFNAGYTGSEAFARGSQFGFFPALSAAWVPTQYQWVKDNVRIIDFVKIRGSWGQVGNDRPSGRRFPYLTTIVNSNSGPWGAPEGAITEGLVGSDNLVWEKASKYNLGFDINFFKNRFNFTIDFFKDKREGIFQERANIPEETGLTSMPWANVGSMESKGFDGQLAYSQSISKDMSFTLRANYTFSKNKVLHWEQPLFKYNYQSWSGVPYGVQRGLISLGLFKDEEDIKLSPKQTFGEYLPGDIKYKDVNGDGVIDEDDVVPLTYSNTPQLQYGFAGEFRWKKWSVGAFFEGTSRANFFYGGTGFYPFSGRNQGNILTIVADSKNRWIPQEYSGDPSTENPNARFPRLTYGENKNNNRNSTFWLANAQYIRLKNVQVAYTLENNWLKSKGVGNITFSLVGDNLAVWDDVKLWDPAQASENGAVYPLQRTYTAQIFITF